MEWTTIRVSRRRGGAWRVEVEGVDAGREFRELGPAETHALAVARARRPSQVLVTGARGEVLVRRVYAGPQELLR